MKMKMRMSSFFYEVLQVMEHQWNEIDRGKPTTRRKTCPSATLSTTSHLTLLKVPNLQIKGIYLSTKEAESIFRTETKQADADALHCNTDSKIYMPYLPVSSL
jgi:hypothetical protein